MVVGAGENGTLVACIKRKRPRIEDKDSASNSIPTQVIFNILLLLPASILRDIMRFVCKEWNAIISDPFFIRAHFCHSLSSSSSHTDTGLRFLVQDKYLHDANLKRAFYFHTNANANDATGTGYSWSKLKLPFKAAILGSCNGLVLLQSAKTTKSAKDLYVANLVTKAKTRLPSLTRAGVFIIYKPYTTLAFAPSSGQYKVVYVSFVSKYRRVVYAFNAEVGDFCTQLEVKVMVCTIGVDKTWRAIDSKGITMNDEVKRTLMSEPLSNSSSGAGGHRHIYWFHRRHSYGLALDIDAETMYQFAGPKDYLRNNLFTESIRTETDTGVGVGMVHLQDPSTHWKVWELIEPKTWGQVTDIDAAYDLQKCFRNEWTKETKFPHAVWAAGRGLIALLLPNFDVVDNIWLEPLAWEGIGCTKITKAKNGGSMNENVETVSYLEKRLVFCFGSHVASQLLLPFGEENMLSASELKQAQEIATRMVIQYGWGPDDSPTIYCHGNVVTALSMGNEHELEMAAKVEKIYYLAYDKAKDMLQKNRPALEKIVDELLEFEILTGKDLDRILESNGVIREKVPFSVSRVYDDESLSLRYLDDGGSTSEPVLLGSAT